MKAAISYLLFISLFIVQSGSPEETFCGPKSLLVICKLFNIPASFEEICLLTGVDEKGGTTMLNLFQAAQKLKLKVSARKLTFKRLKKLDDPTISRSQ